jgi:hypothetical protein
VDTNYCWVKRGTTKASRRGTSTPQALGFWDVLGVASEVVYNEHMELRPTISSGVNQVAFATWTEERGTVATAPDY